MPNGLAYLMLAIWPIACLVMFRKLPIERAIIWSILGGYLLLPPKAEFNLPLVPGMDKTSIPNLTIFLIILFATREKLQLLPRGRLAQLLIGGFVLCAIPTVLTNPEPILFRVLADSDPIIFVTGMLPGQSVRDIGSVLIGQILTLMPFLIARQYLATEEALRYLLWAMVVATLWYSIPSLIEIRFSPQVNVWIYGFFQHSFEQMMRNGGFRPLVFLPHGLWLALFVCTGAMATAALLRASKGEVRTKLSVALVYLFILLLLCKSAASIVYGLLLVPVILAVPVRLQLRLAAVLAIVAVLYPMVRNFNLIPLDRVVAQATVISGPERAHSLNYRFENEQALLGRAAEKPLFGWGGWGRNLIRDPEDGEIVSIPDGRWIITFGTFGWVGYLCEFGLLALPLILLGRHASRSRTEMASPYIGAVALILGVTLMDMLLNATLTPMTWLTAGAILGYVEKLAPQPARKGKYAFQTHPVIGAPSVDRERTVM